MNQLLNFVLPSKIFTGSLLVDVWKHIFICTYLTIFSTYLFMYYYHGNDNAMYFF